MMAIAPFGLHEPDERKPGAGSDKDDQAVVA
jgi:hypothetical protein